MSPALRTAVARRLAAGGLVLGLGLGAVAIDGQVRGPSFPDQRAASTQAEQARIATLLRTSHSAALWTPSECNVRLLRHEGATSWVMVACVAPQNGGPGQPAFWGGPIRIDGDTITEPEQAGYVDNVRRLFPADLADRALLGDVPEPPVPSPTPTAG